MTPDIYRETILDHYRHPRNYGDLPDANAHARDSNVLCGDVVEMQLRINANRIEDARFRGEGCAISIATASMLTEFSKGKSISEIKGLGNKELVRLLGTDPGPARIECAILGLEVMKAAIDKRQNVKASEEIDR
jgi:nitrogen fixation protein NifU and related proteins